MDPLSTDTLKLISATANRLRLVQIDLAEEPPATRQDRLLSELKQVLDQVPLREQRAFLAELDTRFPTWQDPAPAESPLARQPETMTAAEFAQSLADAGRTLPEEDRRKLLAQLQHAWSLTSPVRSPSPDAVSTALRTALGLGPGDRVDAGRALELAALLVDFVQALDQLMSKTWRGIRPNAPGRHGHLQRTMAAFVRGAGEAPMARDLLELRQLAAALTNAILLVGKRFSDKHLVRFSPSEIEETVRVQRSGMFTGFQARCWRHYCKLATGLQDAAVEAAMCQVIAELVEPFLMAPANRTAGE